MEMGRGCEAYSSNSKPHEGMASFRLAFQSELKAMMSSECPSGC